MKKRTASLMLMLILVISAWSAEVVNCTLNPYSEVDFGTYNQYKAQLHNHTTNSDGSQTPTERINNYDSKGYEILSITDHDYTTWPWPISPSGMLAIRGNEYSSSHHMNAFINFTQNSNTLENGIPHVQSSGGLSHINHPGRYYSPGDYMWYVPWFTDYDTCVGIEVYNQGDRYSDDRQLWDNINWELFTAYGQFAWGFSNDDTHTTSHLYGNWQYMLMPDLTETSFRTAMNDGAFYYCYEPGRSGNNATPTISNIVVDDGAKTITLTCSNYTGIEWIAPGDPTVSQASYVVGTGTSFDYSAYTNIPFVRAEVSNADGISYTQPFGMETSTVVEPPTAPNLVSPADLDTIGDTTPPFNWDDVSGAESYTILVDNNSDFSSPEINQTVAVSDYTPGTAMTEETHYWKVLATNTQGDSPYSNTRSFTIAIPNIGLSVASISTTAPPEGTDADSFDISNTGNGNLDYTISHQYTGVKADITVHSNNFDSGLGSYTDNGVDINWTASGGQAVLNAHTGGNPNGNTSATLTSDSFGGTQCTGLTLTFDQNFAETSGSSTISVEYYDGSSWTQIYSANASTTASQSLTLTNIASNMQIRFTGDLRNRSGDSWSIDNVVVYGPEVVTFSWLQFDSSTTGTVTASGANTINITCDAAGLTEGIYTADITVDSNDPDQPSEVIPVTFDVTAASVTPAVPANIVTSVSGTDLVIDWDVSADAESYDVYSSNDPYGTFSFEANVTTNQYVTPYTDAKKFYYIVAKNSTK